MSQVPESELVPEFVRKAEDFCKFILQEASAKRLRDDRIMTGSGELKSNLMSAGIYRDIINVAPPLKELLDVWAFLFLMLTDLLGVTTLFNTP